MKLKKSFCLLAAALLLFSLALFAACSSSEDDPAPETQAVAVTSLTIDKTELSLPVGGTGKLAVTVAPNNATVRTTVWTSSDESVASVKPDGTVTAKKEGKTTVTVKTVDGAFTVTCAVTVTPAQA